MYVDIYPIYQQLHQPRVWVYYFPMLHTCGRAVTSALASFNDQLLANVTVSLKVVII